jgi:putative ABC transport system substrate-binding protein
MRRRDVIAFIGAAAIARPFAARAQQLDRIRRISLLTPLAENDPEGHARVTALRQALEKLGRTEGRNFHIDYNWSSDEADKLHATVAKLLTQAPDVIVVNSTVMLAALKSKAHATPIVFVQVPDPVQAGFVASLARPGGNVTGFTNFEYSLGNKWLELLKEIMPGLARTAVVQNPADRSSSEYTRAIKAAARSVEVHAIGDDARDHIEIERALNAVIREPNAGLIVLPGIFTAIHHKAIVALATRNRLAAVYPYRYFVASGGLVSYGVETTDLYRRAASYVDRVLKGEKPADLPVQAPIRFELVVNLKTAKTLGVTIPQSIMLRADEVIE